jgi:hypothetical protein
MPEATISLLILLASIINNAWQKNWLLLKKLKIIVKIKIFFDDF